MMVDIAASRPAAHIILKAEIFNDTDRKVLAAFTLCVLCFITHLHKQLCFFSQWNEYIISEGTTSVLKRQTLYLVSYIAYYLR